MRRFLLSLTLTLLALPAAAAVSLKDTPTGTYVLDRSHSALLFSYAHMGLSNTYVRFEDIDATLTFNAEDTTKSKIDVTINPASADSNVDAMDAKFLGDELFDVKKYPRAGFVSTKVEKLSDTTGKIHGDLTFHGVTKPVVLDVTLNGAIINTYSKSPTLGFSAKTRVKRTDFLLGMGVPLVSDEIDIVFEGEFTKTNAK